MDINNVFNGGGDQLQADAEKGTVLAVLLDDKLHPRAQEVGQLRAALQGATTSSAFRVLENEQW